MKKTANVLVSVCMLGFLFLAMLVTIVRPKSGYSYYENRSKAPFPAVTRESVIGGKFFTELEACLADQAALRETALRLKTAADLYLLRRPVVNDVVVTDGVLLPHLKYMTFDSTSVTAQAERFAADVRALQTLVEGYGGAYYFVGVPCQYTYYEDQYPWYLENRAAYTQTVLSSFTAAAERLGVHFLDMGGLTQGMPNPDEFSSAVDNHYSLKGAYFTYEAIVRALEGRYGLSLAFPEDGDVAFHRMPNDYLGSRPRKLMDLLPGTEKLYRAEFSEDIPFTRTDNGVAVSPSVYTMPASEAETLLYSFYMGGDIGETVISTGRDELPSVLIYGDSFTNALECLIYYSFDEMRTIDLRHYRAMPLSEYIEAFRPDVVLCIRDHESLIDPSGNGNVFGGG